MPKTEPISISCETYGLAGNLVLPDNLPEGAKIPGAVMVGGPGPAPLARYSPEGAKNWPVLWSEALGQAGLGALCYDQRGSGLSAGVYHDADWDALYEDNRAATDMLGVQPEIGPVAAVAWDDGCAFALKLAAEGLVQALVLMAPAYRTAGERFAADIARLAARRGLSDRVVQIRVNQWKADVAETARRVAAGERISSANLGGQTVHTNLARLLQTTAFNPAEVVSQVKVPVLLLHGADDSVIFPAESEAMAAALSGPATRKTYAGAGHFVYRERTAIADAAAWLRETLA